MPKNSLEKIQGLISELIPANGFYSSKFKNADISDIQSLDDFRKIPFTTKGEIAEDQASNPPYGTNLTFPIKQYTRCHRTSGTSGDPLIWLDTRDSWDWMLDNWLSIYRHSGITEDDRAYFAFSYGPFIGFWCAHEAAAKLGCLCIPGGGLSSTARIRQIIELKATLLCCTPTYALRLKEVADNDGIDLADTSVKTIIVAGEPGGCIPEIKSKISKAWNGATVLDHHGMTETGPVSYESPAEPGILRILEDRYYVEIVNPETGELLAETEQGELVLTTLGRSASPLIRYRTGDLVKPLPRKDNEDIGLDGGIIGRVDDMVIIRGVNIYPAAVDAVVKRFPDITEYNVNIDTTTPLPEISLLIESKKSDSAECLERELSEAFALRIPVSTVESGTLPHQEFKAKRWSKS